MYASSLCTDGSGGCGRRERVRTMAPAAMPVGDVDRVVGLDRSRNGDSDEPSPVGIHRHTSELIAGGDGDGARLIGGPSCAVPVRPSVDGERGPGRHPSNLHAPDGVGHRVDVRTVNVEESA